MKKRRKKRAALPRVSLIAYSAADLIRFSESVEKLSGLVNDLYIVAERIDRATTSKRKPAVKPDAMEGGG